MSTTDKKIDHATRDRLRYDIQTRGYSLITDYMDNPTREVLRKMTRNAIESYKPHTNSERSVLDQYQIHDLLCQDIGFCRLLEESRLQQLLEPFLGRSWIMYAFTSSSIPPHNKNYSARIHVDSPRFQPNYITNMGVIWTLDEYRNDNGPLKLLPGSHHSSEIPDEEYFEKNCIEIHCQPGTLILFNARVVHRTGANNSDEWRHSLTMNCCRCFMKQRMDWVRFVPPDISDQLNEQARRILGFDSRLPSSLEEFFVPDNQRLYKGGQE